VSLKNVASYALLLFVAASIFVLVAKSLREKPVAGDPSMTTVVRAEAEAPQDGMIAYYFHSNVRCVSCETIESYAHEAVQTGFGDRLEDGSVQWRVVNYEEPANQDVVDKYEIIAPVVVLSRIEDGKETSWASLDRVWQLIDDKEAFVAYVQEEATALMP
jgi:hypothetical protein